MAAHSPVYKASRGCCAAPASPFCLLRRVLHPAALACHVAAAVAVIVVTAVRLDDQTSQGQHATCLATTSVSDPGYCSYLYLAAALPLAGFAAALLCCWPACPGTCSLLRVCRGVYGVVLTAWWAVAAGLLTQKLVDGALPPPWDGWQASRIAVVALLYVALGCSLVQTAAGPGVWAGCCAGAAEAAAAEDAAMETGTAPGAAYPWLRMDNRTLFAVGVLGGAAS